MQIFFSALYIILVSWFTLAKMHFGLQVLKATQFMI